MGFGRITTVNRTTYLQFLPVAYNENINNFTFDNVHLFSCVQPNVTESEPVEDLMCMPRPKYIPGIKTPCYRDASDVFKCMPYFNVLGFDKCATTDMFTRLTAHPSIIKCNAYVGKEIYYWGWRRFGKFLKRTSRILTLDGYTHAFRNASSMIMLTEGQANQPIVGDGGPIDGWDFRFWTFDPQNKGLTEPKVLTPHQMRHILPNPKFIVLMREPAERLYSDYYFLRFGDSAEKFHQDVPVAIDTMNSCLKVNTTRHCFFSDVLYRSLNMRFHISCYAVFLREWLSVFHRNHFFFLRTEDYEKDVKGSLQKLYSFLGVETLPETMMNEILEKQKMFVNFRKAKRGKMFKSTRKLLQDFYSPCNEELSRLLGDERYLWQDILSQQDVDNSVGNSTTV